MKASSSTEVIHVVSSNSFPEKLHLVQRNDKYAVIEAKLDRTTHWMSSYETIKWAFIPSVLDACHRMDKFILGYFPEEMVVLVALESL